MTAATKDKKYIQAIGRRKTASAQVRLTEGARSKIVINGKDIAEYFATDELQKTIQEALVKAKESGTFMVSALVKGGGKRAQAEAIRHGISRALVAHDEELRSPLKKLGYLKRDPRKKERKKFGLKKARKAAQWSKR